MAAVDPIYAQWLQSEALWSVRTDAAAAARWGDRAVIAERATGIATAAAAQAEADRQLAFLGRGPFAVDVHQLVGVDWAQRLGLVVTLTGDELGYDEGIDVFVIEAEPDHATGLSTVAVLRPLEEA